MKPSQKDWPPVKPRAHDTDRHPGPLVGLLDKNDPYHALCIAAADQLPPGPMLSTWPCVTEAMYLLGRSAGDKGQTALWSLLHHGLLLIHTTDTGEYPRMAELMDRYEDLPMDLADASLVSLAEVSDLRKVFSLDQHLRIYQLEDGTHLDVMP